MPRACIEFAYRCPGQFGDRNIRAYEALRIRCAVEIGVVNADEFAARQFAHVELLNGDFKVCGRPKRR